MKIFNTLTYVVLFFLLWITGCKSPQAIYEAEIKPLPDSFTNDSNSSNIGMINWREYFQDKNLIQLIDEALNNNPDALVALQRIEQVRASVIFSKGTLLPITDIGASAAIRRYGLYTMDGSGNATTEILPGQIVPVNLPDFFVGLQSTWEADITGKLHNRKKAAVARYLSSVEGRNWIITNLIAEVASSYYDLLALDHELEIIRSTIALQKNAVSIVTIQKQAGAANELAVKQFKAQLLNSKSLEIKVMQNITEIESMINLLLGRFPQQITRDSSTLENGVRELLQAGVPNDLLRNRPDIKQSELELIAAKADMAAAKAAFYPSLNINGGLGFQAFKTSLLFNSPESFVFSLVGGLSAPLLNRSAIKAEFKATNAYQVESLYNYQKNILTAYVEVFNELNNLNNLNKIAEQKKEEVSILSEAVQTSSELYKTGRANYLEILLTQQKALDAKLALINTKRLQLFSSVKLYKALGGGWR